MEEYRTQIIIAVNALVDSKGNTELSVANLKQTEIVDMILSNLTKVPVRY